MLRDRPDSVELLILGAGWTAQFLIPALQQRSITFAATTTTGHDDTIPFRFDPESDNVDPYRSLPQAKTVLITFPLKGTGQSKLLTDLYRQIHGPQNQWIQLGSTGIYTAETWQDHSSPYDSSNARAIAEDELINVASGCVLNLAGLYGGQRNPISWVPRVAKTKEQLRGKKALHLIHGDDVAGAIIALLAHFTPARRWIITDLHVYCWWDLVQNWARDLTPILREKMSIEEADKLQYAEWVFELMVEEGVKALPRNADSLGRALDGRGFWKEVKALPSKGRVV